MYSDEQLRVFETVVEYGSFSSAARSLGRTQASVSLLMARFESELGYQVFDRSGKRVELNKAGQKLYRLCQRRADVLRRLTNIAKSLHDNIETEVKLYLDECFPSHSIAGVLEQFHFRFPHTHIKMCQEPHGADLIITSDDMQMKSEYVMWDWGVLMRSILVPVASCFGYQHEKFIQAPWTPSSPFDRSGLSAANPQVVLQLILNEMGWSWVPDYLLDTYRQDIDYQLLDYKEPIVQQFMIGSKQDNGQATAWLLLKLKEEFNLETDNAS
ncbi:LysR family transcriptional regulator [Vibrio hangzhouensis]|uniref:LysR family transcriptional regulator n=1 Tax=Vibrio hangzhouensis TaxID=462991 RepID=UPI001C96141B|nr:LysR family transcriptional regulator [Vibrio hangzhouensis]MBY6195933.1 LysR family transcriptional regulator [Vibrio hangzhouensis]